VAGIGTGLLISFVFFGFMKKYYSRTLSPLAIITAALVTYIIAEILGGSGVLAVTTAGIFFGNVYHIKHIMKLQEFGRTFSEVLEILVFVLIGSIIKIPWTSSFLIPALLLFLMYLVIRFLSVEFVLMRSGYSFKEKLFLTLNIPKGLAAAVVVFTLITRAVAGASLVLDLIFLFMISSIVLSTIVTHFSKFFTKIDILPREEE
jgi:cell volume regulation protein A